MSCFTYLNCAILRTFLLLSVQQCDYITENYLALAESTNEYQEYFQYAFQAAGLSNPQNWREALDLYHNLYRYASS